ncbi:site-specific integrase [Nonomuraea sp. NPDC048881]|uniref:site-specific integrase n=1 Tax=Nonomuraea sp. NPDC048881 TaxID=3155030 RepID=UPI0033F857E4
MTAAVERFLESVQAATTRSGYAETLARLTAVAGPQHPVAALTPEQYAAVMHRWTAAAAATWNRHLSALVSFTTWPSARTCWPPTPPGGWNAARAPGAATAPSPPPGWTSCSPTPSTPCANDCCGGSC